MCSFSIEGCWGLAGTCMVGSGRNLACGGKRVGADICRCGSISPPTSDWQQLPELFPKRRAWYSMAERCLTWENSSVVWTCFESVRWKLQGMRLGAG